MALKMKITCDGQVTALFCTLAATSAEPAVPRWSCKLYKATNAPLKTVNLWLNAILYCFSKNNPHRGSNNPQPTQAALPLQVQHPPAGIFWG